MADKDFDDLLRNVSQINSRLEITGKLLNDLTQKLASVGANAPLANMVKSLESDIRRLTELKNKMTYESVSKIASPASVTSESLSARQKVFQDVERSLENYKRELDAAIARINKPISTGLRHAADLSIYGGYSVYPQQQGKFRSKIFPELYPNTDKNGAVTEIPRPFRPTSPSENINKIMEQEVARKTSEAIKKLFVLINQAAVNELTNQMTRESLTASGGGNFSAFNQRVTQKAREDAFRSGRLPNFDSTLRNRELGVGDISNANDRARDVQERLLKTLRARILSEERYAQALEQARRQGFGIQDLKRAQTRGTGGIEQLQFQRTDESGVQRRFDTFVNQSGRATPGISNQFRTFGQGVVRDIGELTKWSIALAAVYGPMRKLQELTEIMIENQTRLAEATVSVGSSFLEQEGIFNIAADAAEQAGESISGVIDAFTQAYRATGGAGDQVERLATAQTLLTDSLTLSKLSTLDQASAIDTLSAALRQTTGDLTGGTELLDKWVRVTKVANVDLASLATGFAVLGDAAEAAQISTDQLNGIIAAIGETGVASGRELANTARALVAGFQSDQAKVALENIGVAFEDSTGKARPFLEIMQELSSLRETKVLDDTTFSRLTLALGGGTRRQAAFATFIENFERVGEVAAESSRASGDAQAALAKQLETVQTSLTRLGNAFQELAQTMGTEGGFLGIITAGVDGMTSLVKSFDSLTSILGKATPALAAFIATSLILKQRGQGGIQQALFGVGTGLERDPELLRLAQVTGSPLSGVPAQGAGRQFLQSNVFGTNAVSGMFQGVLASAIPAILNATNKQDRFGGAKATADVIGGITGGVVGSLVAGSPLIGAAVGTAIAEAFVNSTIARSTDIFGYTAPSLGDAGKAPTSIDDLDEALKQAEINLYKSVGGGNESLGRLLTSGGQREEELVGQLNEAIKSGNKDLFNEILTTSPYGARSVTGQERLEGVGITPEMIAKAFEERRPIEFRQEYLAFQRATPEAQRAFREAESARLARGGTAQDQTTAFAQMVADNKTNFENLIKAQRETSREQLSKDRISGDIRGAEYGRRTTALSGFDTRAIQYYTALGDEVDGITGGADDAAKAFEVLNNVIIYGSEDALPQLTSITGEIQTLINLLNDPVLNKKELEAFGGVEGATEQLKELQSTLANLITDANQQALLSRVSVPEVQGDVNKPLSQEDFNTVKQRAQELQDNFYEGFLQIPDDMYTALKSSWDEWAQIVEKSGDVFFQKVSEIDPQFFQQAMQQLLEENKLKSQKTDPFGIQQLDITSQQGAGLQGSINYFSKYLAQNFPQYEQKPEEFGVIFSDYVTSVLHGDNLAVKLALDKLVDLNQKQLDGMYNIPEGATFWVPLTAAYYRPKNEAGGLGLPDVGDAANTNATERNTMAISENTLALYQDRYDKMNSGYPSRLPNEDRYDKMNTVPRRLPHEDRFDKMNEFPVRQDAGNTGGGERSMFPPAGINPITNILQSLQQLLHTFLENRGSFSNQSSNLNQQVSPVVNARLDMRIDNSTQLVVDGRVLASVITPYLANDLIRLEAAQGTITKRVII